MAATAIDSAVFGNLFSTAPMRDIWSDENRTQKYLDVEAALARVQARLGVIPQAAADEIAGHCRLDRIDLAKLREQTERAGSPVLGLVAQLNALCSDGLGEWCHWGATTQDITDTATVLQLREALETDRCRSARDLERAGRTRTRTSRHADDRPQHAAAGDSDHVRLQDGHVPYRVRAGTANG